MSKLKIKGKIVTKKKLLSSWEKGKRILKIYVKEIEEEKKEEEVVDEEINKLLEESVELYKKENQELEKEKNSIEEKYKRLICDFGEQKQVLLTAQQEIRNTKHSYLSKNIDLKNELEVKQNLLERAIQREKEFHDAVVGFCLNYCNSFEKGISQKNKQRFEEELRKKISVFEREKTKKTDQECQTERKEQRELKEKGCQTELEFNKVEEEKESLSCDSGVGFFERNGWMTISIFLFVFCCFLLSLVAFVFLKGNKKRTKEKRKIIFR